MAFPSMVPPLLQPVNARTCNFFYISRFALIPFQRLSSSLEIPFPGGREIIKQGFSNRKVPVQILDITVASLTDSTIKQYTRPLRDWWHFCHASAVSIFAPSLTQFLIFLTQQMVSRTLIPLLTTPAQQYRSSRRTRLEITR